MNKKILIPALALSLSAPLFAGDNGSNMYSRSSFIEKERPALDKETQELIKIYRETPSKENYNRLRAKVGANYDAVIAKNRAKLEELKETAKDKSLVDEMQKIVDDMLAEREHRIDTTMARFGDPRLLPNARTPVNGFLPIIGAKENLYISYTPVTNEEYSLFCRETDRKCLNKGGSDTPANNISYDDAIAYAKWLSNKKGITLRLPTEEEWELAAGHMPKDAQMNTAKQSDKPLSIYANKKTLSAVGAIDMWGNVWEMTSTFKDEDDIIVKGGSFKSAKTECRTENRDEIRNIHKSYDDLGFRLVWEK